MIELNKREILTCVKKVFQEEPIIYPLANTVRLAMQISKRNNEFYVLGSMGMPLSIATGLALGLKQRGINRKVVCIEGDGGLFMNINSLFTLKTMDLSNLILIVLDNEAHGATGGQPTYSKMIDLQNISSSIGLDSLKIDYSITEDELIKIFKRSKNYQSNSQLIQLKIKHDKLEAPISFVNPTLFHANFKEYCMNMR